MFLSVRRVGQRFVKFSTDAKQISIVKESVKKAVVLPSSSIPPKPTFDSTIQEAYVAVRDAVLQRRKIRKARINKQPIVADTDTAFNIDMNALYEALNMPAQRETGLERENLKALKLSPDYLKNLKARIATAQKKLVRLPVDPKEGAVVSAEEFSQHLADIKDLMHVNALSKRPEKVQEIFDELVASGVQPTTSIVNLLLLGYHEAKDLDGVWKVFREMHAEHNIAPDAKSFELLIGTLAEHGEYIQASRVFRSMQLKDIVPTETSFELLIRSALKTARYARAWEMFDFLRSRVTSQPGPEVFNMMIGTCKYTEDAEKALDLFQTMIESGIEPSSETFANLISALGSREDYYNDAFALVKQMKTEGYILTPNVYAALLSACSTKGDVRRARVVWNTMLAKAEEDPDYAPNVKVVGDVFQIYKSALIRKNKNMKLPEEDATFKKELVDSYLPEKSVHTQLAGSSISERDLFKDIETVWSFATEKSLVDANSIDTFLSVYCASDMTKYTFPKAQEIFESYYTKFGVEKTGDTYRLMLKLISSNKMLMMNHGEEYWGKLIEWDDKQENEMCGQATNGSDPAKSEEASIEDLLGLKNGMVPTLSAVEKEEIRVTQGRGREIMFKNFITIIKGYSK